MATEHDTTYSISEKEAAALRRPLIDYPGGIIPARRISTILQPGRDMHVNELSELLESVHDYAIPIDLADKLRLPVLRRLGDMMTVAQVAEVFDGDGCGDALGLFAEDLCADNGMVAVVDVLTYIEAKASVCGAF